VGVFDVAELDAELTPLGLDEYSTIVVETVQIPSKHVLPIDRFAELEPRALPREARIIARAIQRALDARGTDLQSISGRNQIGHIERSGQVTRNLGAQIDRDAFTRATRVRSLDREREDPAAAIRPPQQLDAFDMVRAQNGFDYREDAVSIQSVEFGESDGVQRYDFG
jgi:hypothetical protein